MKIEDFGFTPVMGKEYSVTFTKDGEVLSTSIYNGSPLPAVVFPDNAKITLSITDKETGKLELSSEFISYNGKLYKSQFQLPLKNPNTNKNANVYIKDLHYDLTTGSVLVQVQGFEGKNYKLVVSDTLVKHKVMAMPITLQNNTSYSIPTELVQGNQFEVLLQDEHGKSIDVQEFTAPISTDWRYTDTLEDGTLELDQPVEEVPQEQQPQVDLNQQGTAQTEEKTTMESLLPEAIVPYKNHIMYGAIGLALLLILILIIRKLKRRKADREWSEEDPEEYGPDEFGDDPGHFEDVDQELEENNAERGTDTESESDKTRKR